MGFKGGQKNKKGKKAKGKKGKGKVGKGSWSLDGGMDSLPGAQGKERTGPRQTQERDEKMRRGRLTLIKRQTERSFKNKMSKKIRFSDVLNETDDEDNEEDGQDEDEDDEDRRPRKVPKPTRQASEKSIMDRLRGFISGSSSRPRPRDDDIEDDDYELQGDDGDEEEDEEEEEEEEGEED